MNQYLALFTRLMPVWVVIACIVGFIYPPVLTCFKHLTEWAFSFTMLGIGMVLKPEDFKPVLKQPYTVLLGTGTQFAVMPLAAFCIAKVLRLPDDIAVGLILTGCVPGAMASNLISYLAKADTAYSIAVTTTSTFLAPLLTPFFTYIFARTYIDVPFLKMMLSILKMVVIPIGAGLYIKHLVGEKADKAKPLFTAFSTVFIAFICGLIVALNKDIIAGLSIVLFAAVLILNAAGMGFGYLAGYLYRFPLIRKRTLCFEVGMQNAGLGAVLALKHFGSQSAIPNALFATWCIITASLLAEYWSSKT